MTHAEAQMLLGQAKALADAVTEHTLDHAHDALIRLGAPQEMIEEEMSSFRREVEETRRRALIRMAEVAHRHVEDADDLH